MGLLDNEKTTMIFGCGPTARSQRICQRKTLLPSTEETAVDVLVRGWLASEPKEFPHSSWPRAIIRSPSFLLVRSSTQSISCVQLSWWLNALHGLLHSAVEGFRGDVAVEPSSFAADMSELFDSLEFFSDVRPTRALPHYEERGRPQS